MSESKRFDTRDRFDERGLIKFMAQADGYVMVRRPRGMPFVLTANKWISQRIAPFPSASGDES
jgi:hypothetical protein